MKHTKTCLKSTVVSFVLVSFVLVSLLVMAEAGAVPVFIGDLTGTESVEDFEGLPTNADLTETTFGPGWRVPVDNYRFDSGISFYRVTATAIEGDILFGDYSLGTTWFLSEDDGAFEESGNPSGTGFVADGSTGTGIGFVFDNKVNMAGMYVAGSAEITITAFDEFDSIIETSTDISMAIVSTWSTQFLGLQALGIKRVEFTSARGSWLGDDLTYSASVPEPTTWALLVFAFISMACTKISQRN